MKISISGHGQAGKDTLGRWIRDNTSLKYTKSTSAYVKTEMFEYMNRMGHGYRNEEDCYDDRINHRTAWADFIDEFNRTDPAALYKRCLADQDILTGLRRFREFQAVKDLKVIDLSIWVHRPGNLVDPTQGYGPDLCDVTIINDTISSFLARAKRLFTALGVMK